MASDAALTLLTSGRSFEGWKAATVVRSMEHCSGGFELELSELSPGRQAVRRIEPGASCELRLGDEPVITGYVDELEVRIDSGQHDTRVTGRDATADLVDCSASGKTGQWRGQKIERIAEDLCRPFRVPVRVEVDTGAALPSFALQEGETVFEAIERAARIRALMLMSDSLGALLITRASAMRAPTALVLGANVLKLSARLDVRDRFSVYAVKGQAPGNDFFSGKAVSQMVAVATDPYFAAPRYRPLVLTNDAPDLAASLKGRVQWEANVRAARSLDIEVVVQGWRHAEGLWQPNTTVRLQAPSLNLDTDLLITTVRNRLDDSGSTTALSLTREDAFTLLPLNASAGAGDAFKWDK